MEPGWYVLEIGTDRIIVGPLSKEQNAKAFCKPGYYVHFQKGIYDIPHKENNNGQPSYGMDPTTGS